MWWGCVFLLGMLTLTFWLRLCLPVFSIVKFCFSPVRKSMCGEVLWGGEYPIPHHLPFTIYHLPTNPLPLVLPPLTFLDQINYRHQLTGILLQKELFLLLIYYSLIYLAVCTQTHLFHSISYNPPLSFASFCCSTCPSLGQWSPFKMLLIIFWSVAIILYTLHYFLVQQNVPRSPYTLPAHTLKSVTSLESLGSW